MTFFNKKTILGVIVTLAAIVLAGTLFIGWNRLQSQKNYETLAALRAETLTNDGLAEDGLSNDGLPEEDTTQWEVDTSATQVQETTTAEYTYKPNNSKKWLAMNPDYFGWIRVPGTNIDYPFVRSHDNKDYLTLDFNGNYSDAGTLFMDYRNLGNFNDKHTIIYGHYMKNKTLFHNLTNYHQEAYFEQNQTIELSGLYETKTYQIVSVYEISVDDYAFTLAFDDTAAYAQYLQEIIELSLHTRDFDVDPTRNLLTLVTCSYGVNNGRTIIHAIEQ